MSLHPCSLNSMHSFLNCTKITNFNLASLMDKFATFAPQQAVPSFPTEASGKESPGNTEHHAS